MKKETKKSLNVSFTVLTFCGSLKYTLVLNSCLQSIQQMHVLDVTRGARVRIVQTLELNLPEV